MPVATFTKAGAKTTTPAKLDKAVFGVEVKHHELLKQAYTTYLANGRENLAKTKTRGDVSGGGKKPWRQKGTGRARFGSSRVPIWRGGGITFGPTGSENYTKQLNLKAKRLAIRQALTLAADANKIVVIEDLQLKEAKTAELAKLLAKIDAKGRVLLVAEHKDEKVARASKNIPLVELTAARYINVFTVLNADTVVLTKSAVDIITEWLGGSK